MEDYLVRALAADGQVRAFAAATTELVEEARRRHNTFPTATAALGRTLTASAMMGMMLKNDDQLTVQIMGGGPIGQVVTTADAKGSVRGYVTNPRAHFPPTPRGKLDVGGVVGRHGNLYVIKDLGLKEPYSGSVPLVSGEIGEDFAYYFARSEQTPSVVSLGVLVEKDATVRAAGGYIIQLMPGAEKEIIGPLEAAARKIPPVSSLVDAGKAPEEILEMVLSGLGMKVIDQSGLRFRCSCSKERLEQVLLSLGKDELRDMLATQGGAELVCHFCREKYYFSGEELAGLLGVLEVNEANSVQDQGEGDQTRPLH